MRTAAIFVCLLVAFASCTEDVFAEIKKDSDFGNTLAETI